jgi:putative serine protease PepD
MLLRNQLVLPAVPRFSKEVDMIGDQRGYEGFSEQKPSDTHPNHRRIGAGLTAALLLTAAVVGGAAGAVVSHFTPGKSSSTPSVTIIKSNALPGPALVNGVSIPNIVKKVLPKVVSVDATGTLSYVSGNPFGIGNGLPGEQFKSAGTGMVVSSSGLVLTNNHVIAGATSVAITLDGQTKALPAEVVGTDPSHDMALLKIVNPPKGLATVTFGNSSALVPGDAVIAIGNALGLSAGSPTVTSGIVSALGRQVTATIPNTSQTETLTNMIQTDAAINPGNSGGPLVDSSGDIVGMNTADAGTTSGGTQAQNIGFAIPSSEVETELPVLEKGGTTGSPGAYLGVEVEDNSPLLAQEYGFAVETGAVIIAVDPGSPASSVGLVSGDVIVGLAGKPVSSSASLGSIESSLHQGDKVSISFYEGTREVTVPITLGTKPAP